MIKIIQVTGLCVLLTTVAIAQKIDQVRMERDIAVSENVLSTLLRQHTTGGKGNFYFNEVKGDYMPGYGVMFSVPFNEWSYISVTPATIDIRGIAGNVSVWDSESRVTTTRRSVEEKDANRLKTKREQSTDSILQLTKEKYMEAMKIFLADYGDMLSQLGADEKIMVTNRPTGFSSFDFGFRSKRALLSAEISKADLAQFKQGKLNRDQLIGKIKVTNTESSDEVETDLELFASILNRLYRSDLSRSFFSEGNMYYERLNDYGAVYYMQVYSSNRDDGDTHTLPTVNLRQITEEQRNKKVIELYPTFEKDLKENIIEYGRTIKSLKPDEMLIVNVRLTKCVGCGIPATLETSIKGGVLQEYATGKITKEAAAAKINMKRGPNQ